MKIYTDGATSNNGYHNAVGAWAFAVIDDNENIYVEGHGAVPGSTNNVCEMTAILKACKTIMNTPGPHTVYSDSSYCINCYEQKWYKNWLENGWLNSSKKPVANKELWMKLIPFFEDSSFDFQKVKGHSVNKWNNYVDNMAVKAKEQYMRDYSA